VRLREAARGLLTLDWGGVPIEDWIFTFKHLRANDIQLIKDKRRQDSTESR
jgi:hypothetical protein